MGIETIKKQIAEEIEKYDIMIKELDAERANITELIRTFVKGKQRDIIEEEVKRKAD